MTSRRLLLYARVPEFGPIAAEGKHDLDKAHERPASSPRKAAHEKSAAGPTAPPGSDATLCRGSHSSRDAARQGGGGERIILRGRLCIELRRIELALQSRLRSACFNAMSGLSLITVTTSRKRKRAN